MILIDGGDGVSEDRLEVLCTTGGSTKKKLLSDQRGGDVAGILRLEWKRRWELEQVGVCYCRQWESGRTGGQERPMVVAVSEKVETRRALHLSWTMRNRNPGGGNREYGKGELASEHEQVKHIYIYKS